VIRRLSDWLRERRIDRLRIALARATGDGIVMAWADLAHEISQRSAEQVDRMGGG
jgi:hypothetical protein